MEEAKAFPLGGDHGSSEVWIPVLPTVDGGGVDSDRPRGLLYGEATSDQAGEGFASGEAPLGRTAGFPVLHGMDIPGRGGFAKVVTLVGAL